MVKFTSKYCSCETGYHKTGKKPNGQNNCVKNTAGYHSKHSAPKHREHQHKR